MTKEEWLRTSVDKAFRVKRNPLELGDQIRLTGYHRSFIDWYHEYLGKVFEVSEGSEADYFYFTDADTGELVRPGYSWGYAYFELVNEKETTW